MGRTRSDIADDGYVWHKYGSKNVRGRMVGYFKCTHVGCGSRKKVWRQANGDEVVERDGTHAHVAPGGRYEYVGEVSMHDDEEDDREAGRREAGDHSEDGELERRIV